MRSLALLIGQPAVPLTLNRSRIEFTGLLSTVRRVAVPKLTVGCDASIVVSSVGAKVRVPPLPPAVTTVTAARADSFPAASTAVTW